MLKNIWKIACFDLLLWRRSPSAIAAALIPPLGMTLILLTLSLAVLQQPIALVNESKGTQGKKMQEIIQSDTDAYVNYDFSGKLTPVDAQTAHRLLLNQQVAGIIRIPADFDEKIYQHRATVQLILNNVDIDFADDIRRSVDRSVAQFDAPSLKLDEEEEGKSLLPIDMIEEAKELRDINPYRVSVLKKDLRGTNVEWFSYQMVSALILLILNVGLMGTALLCADDIEKKTAGYLLISPQPAWGLVAGRLLGGVLASLIALVPALALCQILKIINIELVRLPVLVIIFLATILASAGVGAVVGTVFRGARIIALAGSVISTYLFLLGGGFTTIAFVPQWLRDLSLFIPTRYAIDGIRQVLFYSSVEGLGWDIGVLLFTAFISVLIGSLAIKRSWSS